MTFESKTGIDSGLVFRETFNDEQTVRENWGTPTADVELTWYVWWSTFWSNYYFKGWLNQFKIYNKLLTSKEVMQLYTSQSPYYV